MDKKYELTYETTMVGDRRLHRIRAIRDFGTVKAGTVGGFIESEDNLSHDGNCWVGDGARVFENASVSENAEVLGTVSIDGNAVIKGDSSVRGNVIVIGENAKICDRATVQGYASIRGNSIIGGNTIVENWARITNDARLESNHDYFVIHGIGFLNESITVFKLSDGGIYIETSQFQSGRFREFESYVIEHMNVNPNVMSTYQLICTMTKLHFGS